MKEVPKSTTVLNRSVPSDILTVRRHRPNGNVPKTVPLLSRAACTAFVNGETSLAMRKEEYDPQDEMKVLYQEARPTRCLSEEHEHLLKLDFRCYRRMN